ncbi:MAG: amidohydrolase family protein [Spirochaetales bacterium]|nr:amidohydrolase family protein [Spirochaetales bacterium]
MKPELTDIDMSIWERELEDFVPEYVFDAHTHIWSEAHKGSNTEDSSALRLPVSLEVLHALSSMLFPNRKLGYLMLATPLKDIDYEGHNTWIAEEAKFSNNVPLPVIPSMLIVPSMTYEYVKTHALSTKVRVLKPYRVFARDPKECDITEFLPEQILEVADELHMIVTLHLSKALGPADEKNLKDLEYLTKKYPNVTWILAHCARAFNSAHLERSVQRLAAMETVFVDTSAVCDPFSHYLILKYLDRQKILFGTDNISAGALRGTYITFGYGWEGYWQKEHLEHCDHRCTFISYEQLRSQRQAAIMARLSNDEIEHVFYKNSLKLFSDQG